MTIEWTQIGLFTLAATMLLGSPGPGIAALVAVGRARGLRAALPFYGGLQIGLALAAGLAAAGLFALIQTLPFATQAMTIAALAYLLYLAWRIATAPVGGPDDATGPINGAALGGFLLGVSNPKAYLAFASLMASAALLNPPAAADAALKWTICVIVMIIVDILWLWFGAALRQARLAPTTERALNIVMGLTIAAAAMLSLG